jgi:hypothetical protein
VDWGICSASYLAANAASGRRIQWPSGKYGSHRVRNAGARFRRKCSRHDESAFRDRELVLLLADCDASWDDYDSALTALTQPQPSTGELAPGYEAKRREWRRAERVGT